MPIPCGTTWEASTYDDPATPGPDHWPNTNSIDLGWWLTIWGSKTNRSSGQFVYASAGGVVLRVGNDGDIPNPPHGNFVYIDHGGGWVTHYLHMMDAPTLAVGDVVAAGQQIGRVGNTGTVEPHLHYTQLADGVAVRVQFNGANINTYDGNLSPWRNGERLTSANCGGTQIIAQHSEKCLTAPANDNTDGVQITQSTCGANWNQMWTYIYLGMGHYRIQSNSNGKCLDSSGLYAGAPVVQNTCAWVSSQSWLIGRQPNTDQNTWWDYRVTNDLCLDVAWASPDDGVGLFSYWCWAGSNQIFRTATVSNPN